MQDRIFVGRQRELKELKGCLDSALSGKSRVCFVTGEAGSGKTFLVQHFLEQALATDGKLVAATGTCDAQTGISDPYLPFRETLAMLTDEMAAQQAAGKLSPQNTNRLRPILAGSVQVLVEVAPDLVGVLVPGATLAGAVGKAVAKKVGWMDKLDKLAERGRQAGTIAEPTVDQSRIFEQYTAFLRQLSEKAPLILFLDDLQWADGASLSLLFHLGRHIETSRILVLGAYRPDDVALGRDGERHPLEPVTNELTRYYGDVTVDLDNIPEETSHRFVEALLDAEPNCLGQDFRRALYHQTGGHALFTVELVHTMKELDHPYSLTIATLHTATLHAFLGQWPECQASSETAIRLAREGGFRMRQAHAAVLHGMALARQGCTQEEIEELTEGLFMWEATGAGLVVYARACLAEACWIAGRVEEGLRAVDEALYPGEEA